jgi:3-hydroxybutyryl-CoA dehydrogenase
MRIAVITDEKLKKELLAGCTDSPAGVDWYEDIPRNAEADVIIDLLFIPSEARINSLNQYAASLVIVNDVAHPFALPSTFIRINAWPTFLKRDVVEIALTGTANQTIVKNVFDVFHKSVNRTPDQPGFISARVITMIINEAYFALGESVSTAEQIDTAMKLGTNYPYGPFEWSKLIGLKNIHALLESLAKTNKRYDPAPLLKEHALHS